MYESLVSEADTLLKSNGFFMFAHCTCNGTYQDKYKIGGTYWKVTIFPKKGTFAIRKAGATIETGNLNNFNEVFNKYISEIQGQA